MALIRLGSFRLAVVWLAFAIGWPCAVTPWRVYAQTEAPSAAESGPAEATPAEIKEVKPEVFYVRDEEGNLVPLPGKWTLDDFRKLLDNQPAGNLADAGPTYSLQKLAAKATGEPDRVRIALELEIVQGSAGWVRVPLRMPRAIMLSVPKHQGPGEVLVEYADEQSGYVAWIQGQPQDLHKLTCDLVIPLETIGEERRWQWQLPSATTSELVLTVPLRDALVESVPGGKATGSKTVGQTTETKFQGLTGLTRFSWRPPVNPVRRTARTLEASGACLVRLERGYVRSEMTLTLRSFGAPFDRFTVRLPPGAQLVSETIAGGAIATAQNDPQGGRSKGQLYEVKLTQPQTGPLDVRLVTERAQTIDLAGEQIELAGFEVPEAVRQFGHVAVQLVGDWQVLWGEASNARRVETLPSTLPSMDVLAGFEYFSQPFSLPAKVISPPTRIAVEPEYAVYVAAEELRLDSRIQYRIGGAKVYELVFDAGDWDADSLRIDPANLVNLDAVVIEEGAPLRIPLKQPMRGDFEIRLSATRPLPPEADRIEISLPRPESTSQSTALLAVIPADNIALRTDAAALVDLASTQLAPKFPLPISQQQTLLYRADSPEARFVAEREVFDRQLAVDATAEVTVGTAGTELSQRWRYNVLYVPLQSIALQVPPPLRNSPTLALFVDDRPIDMGKVLSGNGGVRETISVPLEKPRLGKLSLRLEATLPPESLQSDTATQIALPLATTLTGAASAMEVKLNVESGVTAEIADERWTTSRGDRAGTQPSLSQAPRSFSAAGNVDSIDLIARRLPERSRRGLAVDRAWIRTWFTNQTRHDRAVYRFRTALASFDIGLPPGIEPNTVEVLLDGNAIPSVAADEGGLRIDLPAANDGRHTLELVYYFADREPGFSQHVELPQLPAGSWIDQQYWQVVLPRNMHLLGVSPDCSPIYRWGWRLFGFGRQPLLQQNDLADWIGVDPGALIPEKANQYVFARFASDEPPQLTTINRSWFVLFAGGGALLAGMLIAWVPLCRHPLTLLIALVGLLAAGFLYPEPVLVAVQVASVGLVLLLLALFLRRYVGHASDLTTVGSESSESGSKHTTTEYFHEPSEIRSHGSSVKTSFTLSRSTTESNA